MTTRVPVVGVIGASSADETLFELARAVGHSLGRRGWHLMTGGGGGVMEAACQGHQAGRVRADRPGVAIGVLPFDEPDLANPYVDIALPTGIGLARNAVIARGAGGLIAIGGCSGTLSEIALAWQFGRPIAAMIDGGGWAAEMAGKCIDDRYSRPVFPAKTATQALDFLENEMGR